MALKFNANVDILGKLTARNFSFQEDVLDIQTDNTLDPGASPATGARYLIGNSASLHANFGTINKLMGGTAATLGFNDIVEYNGTEFRIAFDASAYGEGAKVWDRDSNKWYNYNGGTGSLDWTAESAALGSIDEHTDVAIDAAASGDVFFYNGTEWTDAVLGDGLTFDATNGSEALHLDLLTSGGLKFVGGELSIEPADFAGTGLEDDGSDNLRIASSAAGDGLQGGSGSALAVDVSDFAGNGLEDDGSENLRVKPDVTETSTTLASAINVDANGVSVKVDDSTIEGSLQGTAGSESLRVKDLGITAAKLAADSVTTAKILDSNVTAAKLATDSVTTIKIVDLNVTTAKINDLAVTAGKLATDSVTTAKIVDLNVTTAKLADDAVTTAKIADDAVTADQLATNSVTSDAIASGAVDTAELATDAVDSTKLDYADTGLRSKTATWTNADGTSKTVTHSWSTLNVKVEIFDSNNETIFVDTVDRTTSTVVLTAIEAPPSGQDYTVLISEVGNKE